MSDVDYEVPDVSSGDDGGGEWFYGKIDELVDALELPQQVFEESCRICDLIRDVDGFKHSFSCYGGFDAVVATSVFLGARQSGVPLQSGRVVETVRGTGIVDVSRSFDETGLNRLLRKFRRVLDVEPVFLGAEDYIGFYVDCFDFPVEQRRLGDELFVSSVAVRRCYKSIVEGLTGVETDGLVLEDVAVTPESFGFYGEGVEGFALHLVERCRDEGLDGRSPQVLAASVLYVAGKLLR